MRFYLPAVFTALSVLSTNLLAQTTSSFGPEVSAEDFELHVASLSSLSSATARKVYIAQQFNRLGLNSRNLVCKEKEHGIYATLRSTTTSETTIQYIAQIEDVYQIASVLEITERYMTLKPRPSHDIRFSFVTISPENLLSCSNLNTANLNIQPNDTENLDSSNLVRHLNGLYLEGR